MTAIFFVGTHAWIPDNSNFGGAGLPRFQSGAMDRLADEAPASYSIYLGPGNAEDNPARAAEYRTGFQFLEFGPTMVNGYTGIGHRALATLLCMDWAGQTCPNAAPRLFDRESETGVPYVDLFRIDRIIVRKGADLEALRPLMTEPWRLEYDGIYTQRFVRSLPPMPGSLAWTSPGVTAEAVVPATSKEATLRVSNTTNETAHLVFARLWWPGYKAWLGGLPMPVRAASGIFVTVDVPKGTSGELHLVFRPPFLSLGVSITVFGIILGCALIALHPKLIGMRLSRRPHGTPVGLASVSPGSSFDCR